MDLEFGIWDLGFEIWNLARIRDTSRKQKLMKERQFMSS